MKGRRGVEGFEEVMSCKRAGWVVVVWERKKGRKEGF